MGMCAKRKGGPCQRSNAALDGENCSFRSGQSDSVQETFCRRRRLLLLLRPPEAFGRGGAPAWYVSTPPPVKLGMQGGW